MESKVWEYLAQQAAVVVFMGLVIWKLYNWVLKKDGDHIQDRKEWLREITALVAEHHSEIKLKDAEIKDLNKLNRDMSVDQLKFVHDIEEALAKSDPRVAMENILRITQKIAEKLDVKTY